MRGARFEGFGFVPAPFFLGWCLLQFLQGTLTVGRAPGTGGVACWAHVGGSVAGVAVALALRASEWLRPAPPAIVSTRRRYGRGRWPW